MKVIKCENDNGLAAVLTYDHDTTEFFLVSLDGVYKMKNAVHTLQNATTDGSSYGGKKETLLLQRISAGITGKTGSIYRASLKRAQRVHFTTQRTGRHEK